MSYKQKFIDKIVQMSSSFEWNEAKIEWDYLGSDTIPGSECLCGHHISEVCYIKNSLTGHRAEVGNCCVQKFMGNTEVAKKSKESFRILRGISKNPLYTVPAGILRDSLREEIINSWEFKFYHSIGRKRNLSDKQVDCKAKINFKMIKLLNGKLQIGI
jgi:hypothetical protein